MNAEKSLDLAHRKFQHFFYERWLNINIKSTIHNLISICQINVDAIVDSDHKGLADEPQLTVIKCLIPRKVSRLFSNWRLNQP
ncbi:hypothetical protein OA871_02810 [Paracoccaceae bacterium]|nr:hypothetical protein [Paracoccaceae bacterium]